MNVLVVTCVIMLGYFAPIIIAPADLGVSLFFMQIRGRPDIYILYILWK